MHFNDIFVKSLKDFLRLQANDFDKLKVIACFGSVSTDLTCLLRVSSILAKSLEQCRFDGQFFDPAKDFVTHVHSAVFLLGILPELSPADPTEVKEDFL